MKLSLPMRDSLLFSGYSSDTSIDFSKLNLGPQHRPSTSTDVQLKRSKSLTTTIRERLSERGYDYDKILSKEYKTDRIWIHREDETLKKDSKENPILLRLKFVPLK